ncbi:MAG: PAS domain-containing protein [Pseudomonadota bacterium]
MISMSTGYNGLTEAQSTLIQHWHACCPKSRLPKREALDPGAIRSQLASLSMVEVTPAGTVRFRLAGSSLRQIFGREMRGRQLRELDPNIADMWSLGLSSALERRQPVGGIIHRETDCHAWLRLPLEATEGGALVLCHDALLPKERLPQKKPGEYHIQPSGSTVLAA